jgi:FAD/FMN-containing dehydrogenase/Fe-S oxidoreductase
LGQALQTTVAGEVRFDRLTRELYSTDASNYRILPLGVVLPGDVDDICAVLETAAHFDVPVLPRGGGTSLSGQTVGRAIILDLTRHLDAILEESREERWVRVQPGIVLEQLNRYLRPANLMVGPDPASAPAATLGGMLGNNSTGTHSILYGMMADHVLELEVTLANGDQITAGPGAPLPEPLKGGLEAILEEYEPEIESRYPKTWRTVAGYALNKLARPDYDPAQLFVGSEGTLGVITAAKIGLVQRPPATRLAVLQFEALRPALEMVPLILETGPSAIELNDRFFLDLTRRVPSFARRLTFVEGDPRCLLVVEYYGDGPQELTARVDALTGRLRKAGYRGDVRSQVSPEQIADVWTVRKAGFGLLMSRRGDAKPLTFADDAAVPVEHLADYAEGVERICAEAGTEAVFFGHASAGCLHTNPIINLKTAEGLDQMRAIGSQIAALAISYGGTTTGEHGEGLARSCFNEQLFGSRLHRAFQEVKALFDPAGRLNPGRVVEGPDMADPALLRFGPAYRLPLAPSKTTLDFSADGGFAGLVEMCNGHGDCRQLGTGTMCPSFMATRDERHSVRGRANALRAAIGGRLGPEAMTGRELYETLDLCLGCKACKSECPSKVDLARLKAEFLDGYYKEHGVPLRARAFAHVAAASKAGRTVRPLSNVAIRSRPIRAALERFLGIDSRRALPALAKTSFEAWFKRRPPAVRESPSVVLFCDTFTNNYEPGIGRAAVEVLEAAGQGVVLAPNVCCGRPFISQGLLAQARELANRNIAALAPLAERDLPIVVLEPSCASALQDEYPDLLPGNPKARLVAEQTSFIDEWIVKQAEAGALNLDLDSGADRVLYHAHCHQRALGEGDKLAALFELIPGCQARSSDAGCCGMAGSFGYEVEHYDLSLKIAEERLLPAVRAAGNDTVIAAPGTSCRQQIRDATGRRVLHPIEILHQALTMA